MRIELNAPARVERTSSAEPGAAKKSDAFSRVLAETAGQSAATVSSVSALAAASLLSAQEVGDPEGARARARRRAESILDRLDELKLAILTGAVPLARLQALMEILRANAETVADPRLAELLLEIELRAAVELAKLEVQA